MAFALFLRIWQQIEINQQTELQLKNLNSLYNLCAKLKHLGNNYIETNQVKVVKKDRLWLYCNYNYQRILSQVGNDVHLAKKKLSELMSAIKYIQDDIHDQQKLTSIKFLGIFESTYGLLYTIFSTIVTLACSLIYTWI